MTSVEIFTEKKYTDCSEILRSDPSKKKHDGVYTIYPDHINRKEVFCDMTTEGGGWTVRTCFVLATKIDGGPIYVLFSIK